MTRRTFCAEALATLAASGMGNALFAASGAPNLRVGLLSDIHMSGPSDTVWFEKALRYFDAQKVDAVAITGDLTRYARIAEMKYTPDVWFKVFPGDRRSDGGHVERLFITGNHDLDAWNESGRPPFGFKDRADARQNCFYFNREKVWEEFFHEKYRPVMVKTCKGYVFVMRNWIPFLGNPEKCRDFPDLPLETSPLKEVLSKLDGRLPKGRPFFYLQHDQIDGTVNAPWLLGGEKFNNGYDDGLARSCLKAYPNCLALTGHSHYSLTDEMSIWQGEFTAVNCSCLGGYAFSYPGRENGFAGPDFHRKPPFEMDKFDHQAVHQGLVMDVYDDRIVFKRLDLAEGRSLGPDWVVSLFGGRTVPPHGMPKYDFASRAKAAKAPQFAADAKVSVRRIKEGFRRTAGGFGGLDKSDPHPQFEVSFPPVTTASSPSRAFEFAVSAEIRDGDLVQVAAEKRVLSPNAMQAEAKDVAPCACVFSASVVPSNCKVRFSVVPMDCWGNRGRAIVSDFIR